MDKSLPLVPMTLSLLGLLVLLVRFKPWMKSQSVSTIDDDKDFVSVIVPCRNEEHRLPVLLASLKRIKDMNFEIIVVDDGSTDQTSQVAVQFGVSIVKAPLRPEAWIGKNWACWTGARVAQGEYFLFTDADTIHRPDSLRKALLWMKQNRCHMMSAPPLHLAKNGFEKYLGLFFLFPLVATAFRAKPSETRLYAIGQYLLFQKEAYLQSGGHQAVSSSMVDDIDFAQLFLRQKRDYQVYPFSDLYQVQMFHDWKSFCQGWIRLIRLGLPRSSILAVVEMILIFHVLTVGWIHPASILGLFTALGLAVVAWAQTQHSKASWISAVFSPLSMLVWVVLSVIAVAQNLKRSKIHWRGRAYPI